MVVCLKLVSKVSIIVLIVLCFALSVKIISSSVSSARTENSELVFVSVLFRHGDRTPSRFSPTDPYKSESFWPDGFGQLINSGKLQAYELGKWLRNRYDSLLTEEYSPDTLYVESTALDRTVMSAQCVLAGMYPPRGRQKWNSELDWQPIPVHSTPRERDRKFSLAQCPAYKKQWEELLQSNEIQQLNSHFSDVFSVLNDNTGEVVSSLVDIELIFGTLNIEYLNNLTLPQWTKIVFPERMEVAAKQSLPLHTWTEKLARVKSGFLVKDMISHMNQKAGDTKASLVPKMWMYSAHDITIAGFLNSLKMFDLHLPPYCAAVLMELRKDVDGKHFVRLLYRNSTAHEPFLLNVPGCASDCPLDNFVEFCKPIIPQDWDEECGETSVS